ncbi:MAG: cupin [Reichenbachiella sp.]
MKTASLLGNLAFNKEKPAIQVLLETENTKEIRIAMREGQIMKKHETPFPITVEIFQGAIDFGVNGETLCLKEGDLISLESSVPHDLKCTSEAVIRLSLSKLDNVSRVKKVVE